VVRLRTKVPIKGTKVKPALEDLIRGESAKVGASTTVGSTLSSAIGTIKSPTAPILPRTSCIEVKNTKASTIIIGLYALRAL
jgi:hypothetical protein